ncbi:MAG: DNA alkylation repair protein [bacterium]
MILSKIRQELKQNIDKKYKQTSYSFFKEKIMLYGVRAPIVRKISKKYFLDIKDLDKKEIWNLCEELLKSGYNEEKTVAFDWAYRLEKQYTKSDFKIFERWLKEYVSNWGDCDDFCTHAFGKLIFLFPEFLVKLPVWAKNKNVWVRRASAVILIYPNRKDKYIDESFQIADILLKDKEDLVQKGYGWLLKEISNKDKKIVFDYVMKNKTQMLRTALRYAIEKLPSNLKKQAMLK